MWSQDWSLFISIQSSKQLNSCLVFRLSETKPIKATIHSNEIHNWHSIVKEVKCTKASCGAPFGAGYLAWWTPSPIVSSLCSGESQEFFRTFGGTPSATYQAWYVMLCWKRERYVLFILYLLVCIWLVQMRHLHCLLTTVWLTFYLPL